MQVFLIVVCVPLILSLLADAADMYFGPTTALLAQVTHMRPRVAGGAPLESSWLCSRAGRL